MAVRVALINGWMNRWKSAAPGCRVQLGCEWMRSGGGKLIAGRMKRELMGTAGLGVRNGGGVGEEVVITMS